MNGARCRHADTKRRAWSVVPSSTARLRGTRQAGIATHQHRVTHTHAPRATYHQLSTHAPHVTVLYRTMHPPRTTPWMPSYLRIHSTGEARTRAPVGGAGSCTVGRMDRETKKRADHDVAVADRQARGDFGARPDLGEMLQYLEDAGWTITPPSVGAIGCSQ